MADITPLDIAAIPVSQLTPNSPAVATHLTYEQAEAILGPYLDVYLNPWAGNVNDRRASLSREGGTYKDLDGEVKRGDRVISIASVRKVADSLHASDHPDHRAEQEHDWPKETEHYQKPRKASAKASAPAPAELIAALAYPGMNLELFHWHGAPPVARLQQILDGAEARPDELQRISEALGRLRASGRSSF